jgi:hypothetical protein
MTVKTLKKPEIQEQEEIKEVIVEQAPVVRMSEQERENYKQLIADLELQHRLSELQTGIMVNTLRYYQAMAGMGQITKKSEEE